MNLFCPNCPNCGATLDLLPGNRAVQCQNCRSVIHIADASIEPLATPQSAPTVNVVVRLAEEAPATTRVATMTGVRQPLSVGAPDRPESRSALLADARERLRAVEQEIVGERGRLSQKSHAQGWIKSLLYGGLVVFAFGWLHVDEGSRTTAIGQSPVPVAVEHVNRHTSELHFVKFLGLITISIGLFIYRARRSRLRRLRRTEAATQQEVDELMSTRT